MAQSAISGPFGTYGNLDGIPSALTGAPSPDPNTDAGPSFFYQWAYLPDVRYIYAKDQATGRLGTIAGQFDSPVLKSAGGIPSALATNNIAAAQNAVSGAALTLAAASLGVTVNVPIIPYSQVLNGGAAVTAALALDFGFAFGNCTAASGTITVAATAIPNYTVGMPLVIGGVGNAGGTVPLLCQVTSIASATTITVSPVPLATNATAPIGTGNAWSYGGNGPSGGQLLPTAAFPFLAAGPGLLLDSGQAIARGVQITGVTAGAGGTFTVHGWDVYGVPMSETITVGAGAVTGWGKKAFKYIGSVVANFADAHNYTVGTSDVFGFNWATTIWEATTVYWAGALVTGAPTGWVAGLAATTASTATTADVRGTVQTSANGGGTGIGSTASNGTLSSLLMTGNRVELLSRPSLRQVVQATQASSISLYGPIQA